MSKNIIISGGGTGGHIFPAISIANELRRRIPGCNILFVGAENRMEMERVPDAGYPIVGLPVAGFDRKRLWRNVSVLAKLVKSMSRARAIVKDFRPDIVIGVGGYASGPVLKAAQQLNIPTLVQEQNSYAGVTNRLLAAKAKAICVAYEGMDKFFPSDRIVLTGNPVRADILNVGCSRAEAKRQLGLDPDKILVAVTGGSLGARTVNDAVFVAIPVIEESGAQLFWQTGKLYAQKCIEKVGDNHPDIHMAPFVSRMDLLYRAADIMVARAGAGTISEIQLTATPSVLIPSPNVAEDHQRKNALALASRGAAIMIEDADAVSLLPETLKRLIDSPAERRSLSDNAAQMALHDAASKIVDRICQIIKL